MLACLSRLSSSPRLSPVSDLHGEDTEKRFSATSVFRPATFDRAGQRYRVSTACPSGLPFQQSLVARGLGACCDVDTRHHKTSSLCGIWRMALLSHFPDYDAR